MKKIMVLCLLTGFSLVAGAASDVCKQERTLSKAEFCSNLDTSNNPDDNPFIYLDPNAKCDLGLQLPGLPDFGLDIGSLSGCEVVNMVTGDSVRDLNANLRDAVNDANDATDREYDPSDELEDIVDENCNDGRCF